MTIRTFAEAEAALAVSLPGYEPRVPQQRLARKVEDIFAKPENFAAANPDDMQDPDWERPGLVHLFGQAGTGTGKSLAYLIPAILSGRRVVVSVTTKALQDQIVATDVPFLEEHLGVPFSWALLKGRSNYVCVNRLSMLTATDVPMMARILEKVKDPDFSGLREDFGVEIPDSIWNEICSDADECGSCTPGEDYAQRAREHASGARLVIVNHALFFTDLYLKVTAGIDGMLGQYEAVVFDEAHSLEEVAGNTLGGKVTRGSIRSMASQVNRYAREFADDDEGVADVLGDVENTSSALFDALREGRMTTGVINGVVDELSSLFESLESLRKWIAKSTINHHADPRLAQRKKWKVIRLVNSLISRLTSVVADDQADTVRWVEVENTRRGSQKAIRIAPINVAPFLSRNLFSKVPCVMVSATLAVKGSFEYISGRLGVRSYISIDVGTPFDFFSQGRLYVPVTLPDGRPMPEPKGSNQVEWQSMALMEIHRLVTASRGRALVLFTSVRHMRDTYTAIRRMPGGLEYRMQGDAPNRELVDWLKDHQNGGPGRVLLATKSFFTGIDIQGDALSLVIISKMPFPVPNEPLTEARCEAIEANGGSAFLDYSIPVMSLEIQQALGRLIRHRNDKGVAAVLDPRLATKGYGRQIMRDLPPFQQTFSLSDVERFFDVDGVPA